MCYLLPVKYQKYLTLIGGILIHISLASSHTFGNMSPYIISYLRSYKHIDVRYSNAMWIYTWLGVSMSISIIIGGFLAVRFKLSLKFITFIGCFLIRFLKTSSFYQTFYLINHKLGFLQFKSLFDLFYYQRFVYLSSSHIWSY